MSQSNKVLVTGATGFVGRALVRKLICANVCVRVAVRHSSAKVSATESFDVGEINSGTNWGNALAGVSVVIHCAAKVHVMSKINEEVALAFTSVNVDGSIALAKQAIAAGAKRFIFLSSVKVNGESTDGREPFRASDNLMPEDPYAKSKADAELALREVFDGTVTELIIVRPPLVYGPGVKANFQRLMQWVYKGYPLPFAAAKNLRSMVYVENLVDLLCHCAMSEQKIAGTYLVSDDDDLSMPNLLRYIAEGLGKRARLFSVPTGLVRFMTSRLGLSLYYDRVFGELRVDIQHTKKTLNWTPPFSAREAVIRTATSYKQSLMLDQRVG